MYGASPFTYLSMSWLSWTLASNSNMRFSIATICFKRSLFSLISNLRHCRVSKETKAACCVPLSAKCLHGHALTLYPFQTARNTEYALGFLQQAFIFEVVVNILPNHWLCITMVRAKSLTIWLMMLLYFVVRGFQITVRTLVRPLGTYGGLVTYGFSAFKFLAAFLAVHDYPRTSSRV